VRTTLSGSAQLTESAGSADSNARPAVAHSGQELRKGQFFACMNWQGGFYATTTMAGSRPGATIAGKRGVPTHLFISTRPVLTENYLRHARSGQELQL
jgi:hypothetical protein